MVAGLQIPVKIRLRMEIIREETKENLELTSFGQYYQKEQKAFLRYSEYLEPGTVHTMVKWDGNRMEIFRRGAIEMRMAFQRGAVLTGTYKTPFGTFLVKTCTKQMEFLWDAHQKRGDILVTYRFFIEEDEIGDYKMKIQFEEK